MLGWVSGIFSALRRRPKFKLALLEGPTFCCTFSTGATHAGHEVHRTGIALYLEIANVGFSPSSIANISVAYHWTLKPPSVSWLKYSVGWFWLDRQVVAIQDFQVQIGDNIKVYPFLIQRSVLSGTDPTTHLDIGMVIAGVVYFEQDDSWGGSFPSIRKGRVRIKVRVEDVFGGEHTKRFTIPYVSLAEARKFNPSFGTTHAELRGEKLPFDVYEQG